MQTTTLLPLHPLRVQQHHQLHFRKRFPGPWLRSSQLLTILRFTALYNRARPRNDGPLRTLASYRSHHGRSRVASQVKCCEVYRRVRVLSVRFEDGMKRLNRVV